MRSVVTGKLRGITTAYTAALRAALNANPTASIDEIISSPDVHRMLTDALAGASTAVQISIRAGYRGGQRHARTEAGAESARLGHDAEQATVEAAFLDNILADVAVAFRAAGVDIVDSVRANDDSNADAAARIQAGSEATDRAVRRLSVRITAAAAVAVHRGYTDTQLAIYAHLGAAAPYLSLRKRWVVTSTTPCPACSGLHDTAIGIDEEFDHDETDDPAFNPPRVYRDLQGPPRHPNCRCRIVLEPTEASEQLRTETRRRPPTTARRVSAADIRRMPAARYKALITFLTVTFERLTQLIRKIRDGG